MQKRSTYFQSPNGTVVEVKDGFSWAAFFFGGLYPLFRGDIRLGAAMLVVFGVIVFVDEAYVKGRGSLLGSLMLVIAYTSYALVSGFRCNSWLKAGLLRRGYSASPGRHAV